MLSPLYNNCDKTFIDTKYNFNTNLREKRIPSLKMLFKNALSLLFHIM